MNKFNNMFDGDNSFMDMFSEIFGDKVPPIKPSANTNNHSYTKTTIKKSVKFNSEPTDDDSIILRVPVPTHFTSKNLSFKFDTNNNSFHVNGQSKLGNVDKEYKINKQIEYIEFVGIIKEHAVIKFFIRKQILIYKTPPINSENLMDI